MHLAIDAAQFSIRIEDRGRVVIEAGRALLEERRDQHDFILLGGGGELFRARAGNRLRQIEQSGVFALAEILRLEEFGQADDVSAFSCRLRNAIERLGQIVGGLGAARHLDQGDAKFISRLFSWHVGSRSRISKCSLRMGLLKKKVEIFTTGDTENNGVLTCFPCFCVPYSK